MRNRTFKRMIALILCIVMLSCALLACDNEGGDPTQTTPAPAPAPAPGPGPGPGSDPIPDPSPKLANTTLAQLELVGDGGMSYVIQLRNGKFIVIDGGLDVTAHKRTLASYLDEHKPDAHEKPVIACWLITHLDGDHFNAMYGFLSNPDYRNKVTVEAMAYTFPDEDDFKILGNENSSDKQYKQEAIASLKEKLAKWNNTIKPLLLAMNPNTEFWDMTTGDVRFFSDVKLQVLMTAQEKVPEIVASHNQRSAVVKFTFTQNTVQTTDDKTFMMLGDNGGGGAGPGGDDKRNQWLLDNYSAEELKSDVMQVIHHGLKGGYLPLYQAVDPDICLWPAPMDRFYGWYDPDGDGNYAEHEQWCTDADFNKWLRNDTIKERKHYHHTEQTTIITMSNLRVKTNWTPATTD